MAAPPTAANAAVASVPVPGRRALRITVAAICTTAFTIGLERTKLVTAFHAPLKKLPMLLKMSENQLKPFGSVKASGSLPT
jgi:hypothetical protein